jgi:hypothetical protein
MAAHIGRGGADGRWLTLQATEGEVRAIGVETVLAIQVAAAVTYTDEDGDGIDDTFTISAASTLTDASQVAVYFSLADRFNGFGATTALSPRWRVQPITVTISGGTVTVKGPKQLCVKPIKYEGVVNIGANGLDPSVRRQLRGHAGSVPALHRDRWQHGRYQPGGCDLGNTTVSRLGLLLRWLHYCQLQRRGVGRSGNGAGGWARRHSRRAARADHARGRAVRHGGPNVVIQ